MQLISSNIIKKSIVVLSLTLTSFASAEIKQSVYQSKSGSYATSLDPQTIYPDSSMGVSKGLKTFLNHYAKQTLYDNRYALELKNHYRYQGLKWSPKRDHVMAVYYSASKKKYGLVAWTIGFNPAVSGLNLKEGGESHYSMIMSPARVCFAINAGSAPVWKEDQWHYNKSQPGQFYCNGLTRGNAFRLSSGFPGKLYPYYKPGDVVLTFDTPAQRNQVAGMIRRLFSKVRFPEVR